MSRRALGIEVSASTVRAYRQEARGHPPSPSWRMFLRLHAPQIWAADFFTVPTLTFRTLSVFVLLDEIWNKGNEAIVDELGPAGAVGRVS